MHNQSCSSVHLSVLHGKNVGHYTLTFRPSSFIPAMLTGTIDLCHFLALSVTLTLAGVTRSAQSKACLLCLAHFSIDQDKVSVGDEALPALHGQVILVA